MLNNVLNSRCGTICDQRFVTRSAFLCVSTIAYPMANKKSGATDKKVPAKKDEKKSKAGNSSADGDDKSSSKVQRLSALDLPLKSRWKP